jgi:hypothetical protein
MCRDQQVVRFLARRHDESKRQFEPKFTLVLLLFNNYRYVTTLPRPYLVLVVVNLGVTSFLDPLIAGRLLYLFSVCLSDPLAREVPLKYFRFRPAACRSLPSDFGVIIHLSVSRSPVASVLRH